MQKQEGPGGFPFKEPEDASDRVWIASNPCPECDIASGPENDDDDFHGCDDCNDLDVLPDILAHNNELVDGKRVLRRLRSFAKRLNNNPSVKELLAARHEAVRGK